MDFLRDHTVSFDLQKGLLWIEHRVKDEVKKQASVVPLVPISKNCVGVAAKLNLAAGIILKVDTGDNGSFTLSQKDWSQVLGKNQQNEIQSTLMVAITGVPTRISRARIGTMDLGGTTYHGLIGYLQANTTSPSCIGLELLRRNFAAFDFPNRLLYLIPSASLAADEQADMSGLHLLRRDDTTFVYAVDEGSTSALAGIQSGDVVSVVDGRDSRKFTIREIRDLLKEKEGNSISFEIERQKATHRINFVLKKAL